MVDVNIIETDSEQMIAKDGYRNMRQFDIQAYCNDHVVASLWQDEKEDWHWTKRLYDSENTEDMDIAELNNKTINGVIGEFVERVIAWLDDEAAYLLDIKNSLDKME